MYGLGYKAPMFEATAGTLLTHNDKSWGSDYTNNPLDDRLTSAMKPLPLYSMQLKNDADQSRLAMVETRSSAAPWSKTWQIEHVQATTDKEAGSPPGSAVSLTGTRTHQRISWCAWPTITCSRWAGFPERSPTKQKLSARRAHRLWACSREFIESNKYLKAEYQRSGPRAPCSRGRRELGGVGARVGVAPERRLRGAAQQGELRLRRRRAARLLV